MGQPTLFDISEPQRGPYGNKIEPRDPNVHPDERQRLSNQCRTILDRLKQGPATNDELSRISRKYTGRLSDLRAAGYVVHCAPIDRKAGLYRYELAAAP